MAEYETTMKDLVLSVRNALEAERVPGGGLARVMQVKRGVLPPSPLFPIVTVIPNAERIRTYRAGRQVAVVREVSVWTLSMDARGRSGIDLCKDIADTCLTILRGVPRLPDGEGAPTVKMPLFGVLDFQENQPIRHGGVYGVRLPVSYESNEIMPTPLLEKEQIDNPSSKEMVSQMLSAFQGKRAAGLANIRGMFAEDWGPRMEYPRILVTSGEDLQGSRWKGVDDIAGNFEVYVESLIGTAKDMALDFHLDLLEPIKDALQEQVNWGGRTVRSEIQGISFNTQNRGKPTYETRISYGTLSKHTI